MVPSFLLFFKSFPIFICIVSFSSARPLSSQGENSTAKCANIGKGRHSYLWTVRHPSITGSVHLFGYFRVHANRILPPVDQEVNRHFLESDVAVFESDDKGIEKLAECIRRQRENEAEHLSAPLWKRLDALLNSTEDQPPFPGLAWNQMPTQWLFSSLLHVLSNHEVNSIANGSEIALELKKDAEQSGKQLEFIERLTDLCDYAYLPSLSHQQLALLIEHLMDELEMTKKRYTDMERSSTRTGIMLYNCGAFETADDLIGQSFLSPKTEQRKNELSELNKRLISDIFTRRNERWIQKIVQLIEQNSQNRTFFAFGTSHLLGENSIVQLLRLRGYAIEEQQSESNGQHGMMKENVATKGSAHQPNTESGKTLFWAIFTVALTIPSAFALCGVIRYLKHYEEHFETGANVQPMPVIKHLVYQNGCGRSAETEICFTQNVHLDHKKEDEQTAENMTCSDQKVHLEEDGQTAQNVMCSDQKVHLDHLEENGQTAQNVMHSLGQIKEEQ